MAVVEPIPVTVSAPPLHATILDTPVGPMRLIASATALRVCDFHDRKHLATAVDAARGLRGDEPAEAAPGTHAILDHARRELTDYFDGRLREFTVPLDPPAGEFTRRVWDALRAIPFGETRSYARQAASIGAPLAVRAVANANGRNFLAILIPCHRVIGSNGTLTGYGGGLDRKRWLLDHERHVIGADLFGS